MKSKHAIVFVAAYCVYMYMMYELYAQYLQRQDERAEELFQLEKKRFESEVDTSETTE